MPDTDVFGWTMPTEGASAGVWDTILNDMVDDDIEGTVNSVKTTAEAALPKAGGVMSGEVEIKTERYAVSDGGNLSGAVEFDLDTSNFKHGVVTGNITSVTFSNWPSSGKVEFFTLELTDGGAHTITWPAAVKWDGGTEPTLESDGVNVLTFYSRDGGTTIRGMHAGAFLS